MVGVPYPTRRKNEGKNLGRKQPEQSKKRRVFFTAVMNLTPKRFKAGKGIMDALVHLSKKRVAGGSNCRRISPRDATLGYVLR